MPVNINRVILTGNLTRDPELRSTPSGASVCEFAIALNSREKKAGEWGDRVDYVDVVAWGHDAENIADHMAKGRPVAVDGRLRQERWQNRDGDNRSRMVVVADRVQFLPSGQGGGRPRSDFDPGPSDFDAPADGGGFTEPVTMQADAVGAVPGGDDDDIPF